jgi:hypothetical protein
LGDGKSCNFTIAYKTARCKYVCKQTAEIRIYINLSPTGMVTLGEPWKLLTLVKTYFARYCKEHRNTVHNKELKTKLHIKYEKV